jgi:hypothetical protein
VPRPDGVAAATPRPATAEELDWLKDSLLKVAREMERWAYTETALIRDEKGKVKTDRVVRHDPSKPYAEQDLPLKIAGQPPTEKQLAEFRRRGEKRGEKIEGPGGLGAGAATGEGASARDRMPTVGELVDLDRALVAADAGGRLTFELPLKKFGNTRFPPENFQVLVHLEKDGHRLVRAEAKLREPFRSKLVVKISSGEASADFAVVDPKYPPALVAARGAARVSILFFRVGGDAEMARTDFKHVKPYRERFDVHIGPLKALDF